MDFDMSELRTFAKQIEATAETKPRKVRSVVSKGLLNIKDDMRAAASKSRSFKQIAPTISYELRGGGDLGRTVIEGEVGPVTSFRAARIENIAYFGSSRAGGGTVEDPRAAGEREAPRFAEEIAKLGEEIT